MTEIFAHRGASGYVPENTMPAFLLASEQGADGVELDVQLSKDGEVVVIHDETLDRVSGISGYVRDYSLKELKEFSFDNGMESYKGVRIPTLEEVLECMKTHNMKVNIELKTGIFWYPGIEEKVRDVVRNMNMEQNVIYSSFNHYSIQKVKHLCPDAETAYLYSDVILNVDQYARQTGVQGLHPAVYHIKMDDFDKKYRECGMKVRIWTVNEEKDMKQFIQEGYDAIITNYPDKAVRIRDGIKE